MHIFSFNLEWRKYILSIDGLFGLCRKKSAGQSVHQPLQDWKYFEPQAKVDSFVDHYHRPYVHSNQVVVRTYTYV